MEQYQKRITKETKVFKPAEDEWSAFREAGSWLKIQGYQYGSMDVPRLEIAVKKGPYVLPQKWHNFYKADKLRIDGIMLSSNYRNGEVKVILFN